MMLDELRRLASEIAKLKNVVAAVLTLRQGVVTATAVGPPDTITVTLGGSTTEIAAVRYLASCLPAVGDTVWVFRNGADLLAIGALAVTLWHNIDGPGEPGFLNGWGNYLAGFQTARFCKDAQGFVHLEGLVTAAADPTVAIFTLPAGYRPQQHQTFVVMANGTDSRLDVDTGGNVYVSVYGTAGSSTYVSLNGMFSVA